jgi:uncharacterized membrane protein YeiB
MVSSGTIANGAQASLLDRSMGSQTAEQGRIVSLDQFRGYTLLGMFFVNFCGRFEVIPAVFKHHNTYCSYADTIMPWTSPRTVDTQLRV